MYRSRSTRFIGCLGATLLGFYINTALVYSYEIPDDDLIDYSASPNMDLQLAVILNDYDLKLIAAFHLNADGSLSASASELNEIGIKPDSAAVGADGLVKLSAISALTYKFDEAEQKIFINAAPGILRDKVLDFNKPAEEEVDNEEPDTLGNQSFGGLLNYTFYGTTYKPVNLDRVFSSASAGIETRVFSKFGTLSAQHALTLNSENKFSYLRLGTSWNYNDQNRMIVYNVGDFASSAPFFGRPILLGGIQIKRDFQLNPNYSTLPLPNISGSASLPSSLDIYLNNTLRTTWNTQSGPFSVNNIPVSSGANTVRLVVRDVLGREVVTEMPFFSSGRMLAKGLVDFSIDMGFARRFYGVESMNYDKNFVGMGTVRYGLSSNLTVLGHTEIGAGLYNAGAAIITPFFHWAELNASGAYSQYHESKGYQLSASLQGEIANIGFAFNTQRVFGDYNDLASVTAHSEYSDYLKLPFSAKPPKAIHQASVSFPLKVINTQLSLTYTDLTSATNDRNAIGSFSLSRPIGKRGNLYVTAFKNFSSKKEYGVFAGLSFKLDADHSVSTQYSGSEDSYGVYNEFVRQEKRTPGGYGYRLRYQERKDGRSVAAIGSYNSSFARFEGGVSSDRDQLAAYGQAEGSLLVADGDVFATSRIDDAFAVIDVGAPNVMVFHENREVGRTRKSGKILIPTVNAFTKSKVSIDINDLPLDSTVSRTAMRIQPKSGSGVSASFDNERHDSAANLAFMSAPDAPLPVGSEGKINGQTEAFIIGYDGFAYIPSLSENAQVTIETPDGNICQVQITQAMMREQNVLCPLTTAEQGGLN